MYKRCVCLFSVKKDVSICPMEGDGTYDTLSANIGYKECGYVHCVSPTSSWTFGEGTGNSELSTGANHIEGRIR